MTRWRPATTSSRAFSKRCSRRAGSGRSTPNSCWASACRKQARPRAREDQLMTATEKGALTEWPQSLVWARFATYSGAADALTQWQQGNRPWLVHIDNAATVAKNQDGVVTVNETGDRTGLGGLGAGALIGGLVGLLFPPAILAGAAAG